MSTTLDLYISPVRMQLSPGEAAEVLYQFCYGVHKLTEREHGKVVDELVARQGGERFSSLRALLRSQGTLILEVTS